MTIAKILFTAIVFAFSGAFTRILFEEYKRRNRK